MEENTKQLAKQMAGKIATSQPIIADFVEHGKAKVVPASYDLQSGEVSVLSSE